MMVRSILLAMSLAVIGHAAEARAQAAPAETRCAVESRKERAVSQAQLGIRPWPADRNYDKTVTSYYNVTENLKTLRAWVKANPRHICAPDARAILTPREEKIQAFSRQPTAGAQPASFTRRPRIEDANVMMRSAPAGVTVIRLFVEADGKLEGCDITRTSGVSDRDDNLCRSYIRHARFLPARDARGLPISSFVEQRVNWEAIN